MTQATMYIGLNDKDEKRQTMETVEAYKIVQSELVRHVGGGTIYAAEGIYTHDDGTIVVEKTLRVEIFGAPESALMALGEHLKLRLIQESIIVLRATVETLFA